MGAINGARVNIGNIIKETALKFPISATGALGVLTVVGISLATASYLTKKAYKVAVASKEIATQPAASLTTKEVKSQKQSKTLDFIKSFFKNK